MKRILERYQAPLAAALLVMIVVLLLASIALPLRQLHRGYDAEIARAQDRVHRYEAIIETESAVSKDFERLRQQGLDRYFYPVDSTPVSVAGELQKRVKSLVEESGGTLISTQVLRVDDDSPYPKTGIRVSIQSEMRGIQRILHGIEASTPLLFAEGFSLRPAVRRGGRGRDAPQQLAQLELDIFAYQAALAGESN